MSNIENLFELLSVVTPIRVLIRTDKFLEPIELLGSKSDSGNMKRHPIGQAFSKKSTACTRGFSSPVPSLCERKTSGSQGKLLTHPLQRPKQRDKFYKLTPRRDEESISDKHIFQCHMECIV